MKRKSTNITGSTHIDTATLLASVNPIIEPVMAELRLLKKEINEKLDKLYQLQAQPPSMNEQFFTSKECFTLEELTKILGQCETTIINNRDLPDFPCTWRKIGKRAVRYFLKAEYALRDGRIVEM